MHLFPSASLLARNCSLATLALVLLLTPACNAFCRAQACDAPQTSPGKSMCHESGANLARETAKVVPHSMRGCSGRELPVAMLTESRPLAAGHALTGSAEDSIPSAIGQCAIAPAASEASVCDATRSQSPLSAPTAVSSVLRI